LYDRGKGTAFAQILEQEVTTEAESNQVDPFVTVLFLYMDDHGLQILGGPGIIGSVQAIVLPAASAKIHGTTVVTPIQQFPSLALDVLPLCISLQAMK
jgi:hypothetical protein